LLGSKIHGLPYPQNTQNKIKCSTNINDVTVTKRKTPKHQDVTWIWFSPGYGSHTSEFLDVPDANESIGTARGKVLAPGVHLDTDTVGRVGIQNNLGLYLRVAGGTINMFCNM